MSLDSWSRNRSKTLLIYRKKRLKKSVKLVVCSNGKIPDGHFIGRILGQKRYLIKWTVASISSRTSSSVLLWAHATSANAVRESEWNEIKKSEERKYECVAFQSLSCSFHFFSLFESIGRVHVMFDRNENSNTENFISSFALVLVAKMQRQCDDWDYNVREQKRAEWVVYATAVENMTSVLNESAAAAAVLVVRRPRQQRALCVSV